MSYNLSANNIDNRGNSTVELPSRSANNSSIIINQNHASEMNVSLKDKFFNLCSQTSSEIQSPRKLHFDSKGYYEPPIIREDEPHINNRIKTSKYSILTFLPLNLFEQIIRPANFYFCIIAVLQSIPEVSISGGTPTILLPLTFVFAVTALKDALEDLKRHRDDKAENQRPVTILDNNGSKKTVMCQDIQVGDIVRIEDHQRFPADILMLTSAKGHKVPYCYVETSNIDGETNLKLKQSPEGLNSLPSFDNKEKASKSFFEYQKRMKTTVIESDAPNGQLDNWAVMLKGISVPLLNGALLNDNDEEDEKDLFMFEFDQLTYEQRNIRGTVDNFLLRGSELRNSDWIYGIVIYTGFDCKIFMNNKSRETQRIKRSSVEKTLNKFIYIMALSQSLICIMCAIISGDWLYTNSDAWYLDYQIDPMLGAFFKFFTWFIIFAQFIPISLLVSMEIVKFIQAQFMQWDIKMYARIHGQQDKFCSVQSSNLNEELGQIQYVFSDKTGTLTDNSLDFRKCAIGNENYGRGETEIGRAAKRREEEMQLKIDIEKRKNSAQDSDSDDDDILPVVRRTYTSDVSTIMERHTNAPHVNFDEEVRLRKQLAISMSDEPSVQSMLVRRFLTVLALNNSCFPVMDEITKELSIRASSPDDECLTCFAQFIGVQLTMRKPPQIILDLYPEKDNPESFTEHWEQLAELEFTSKRKRMTIVCRNRNTGKIHFTMKGADSEMQRFIFDYETNVYRITTERYLNNYSEEGLRTLVIGEAIKESEWWDNKWKDEYEKFMEETLISEDSEKGHLKGTCSDSCRKCIFYERFEMEAKIELLGITAIEDKLQESVPETISALLDGGINVWILTGDKQKTAENIGIACNLLEPSMERHEMLFKLISENKNILTDIMINALRKIEDNVNLQQPSGMVINSKALKTIFNDTNEGANNLQELFLDLSTKCKSVIGVRLQPNQKAQIIKFIQLKLNVITLAIGDGANDEPMIKIANVGVGITGLEGTAAVRASDYAIAKFKFLKRLMFVHGRLQYRRITTLICYMFYKNGLVSLSSFWFGIYSGFSGQVLLLDWAYQLYNVVYTSLPIFHYAIIDRDYDDAHLLNNPQLYIMSQSGDFFNIKVFFTWILDSLLASFLLIFIPVQCYAWITSPDYTAQSSGLWTTGVVCYTAIVFTANFRLAFITNSWTFLTHFFFIISIVGYFLTMIIFNVTSFFAKAGADYYWVVFRAMDTWRYWLVSLLATLIALFIPFTYVAFTTLRRKVQLMDEQIGRKKQRKYNSPKYSNPHSLCG